MTDTTDFPELPEPECRKGEDMCSPEGGWWADLYTADQMHDYLLADRASRAPAQDGWQLVPVEPTEAMHVAAVRTLMLEGASAPDARAVPDNTKVICPGCAHQFRAIPVQVQQLLLASGHEPPFTAGPAEGASRALSAQEGKL